MARAGAALAGAEAELHAAGEFLADLPGRWACGLQDVEKYAKLLAETARRQGWPLDAEFERWLTADERSIRGAYPRVIPARLKNLPRFSAWRRAGAPTGTAANRGPVEGACPNHPHRAAADRVPCRIDPEAQEQKPAARSEDPVPADVIAAAKAFAQAGKSSGRRREKNPRSDARARRQTAGARSAEAEAEAEENRRKAGALLQQEAVAALGLPTVPGQAQNHTVPQ
ncbi:hypothetical protein [Streptomyces sp. H27-C3]|uniref:hypothetical protein n=1 Tax=Streptomyces sp. H27-C3 TaxID=3046305 RepID=UPI0024BBAAAB|nr:hypothetical protein [Streptomyces sp. H27-C3]MDJ0466280.1 hypothetical protein [Streptomyces sp. H27-C3]